MLLTAGAGGGMRVLAGPDGGSELRFRVPPEGSLQIRGDGLTLEQAARTVERPWTEILEGGYRR